MDATAPRGVVFREGAREEDSRTLVTALVRDLTAVEQPGVDLEARLVAPLLSAAALEGSLEDAGAAGVAEARALTDRIALGYLRRETAGLRGLRPPARRPPDRLWVTCPEGFAYYAVVPRDLARAACGLSGLGPSVTVVGLRPIGVALSAVVRAALGSEGRDVDRFTVRPRGAPHERTTELLPAQRAAVERRVAAGGGFVVVDEGPGPSGSGLLSAAEALVARGAAPARIVLLGTRAVDPCTLLAPDAAERWSRFRSVAVLPGTRWPAEADDQPGADLSGGAWRAGFWRERSEWPATWPALERLKRRTRDGRWLLKFEGLGAHGVVVHERAELLGRAGLSPAPAGPPDGRGFVAYPFPAGQPLRRDQVDDGLLETMGRSCAARFALFPAEPEVEGLSSMARTNVALETGMRLPGGWRLGCERPAIVDGRMLPHEWLRTPKGGLLKCDGAAHGDDHLYPGPADVAWDLAGALLEWELDDRQRLAMLAAYRRLSGEDPAPRLLRYEIAYAAHRAAASALAAWDAPPEEAIRLRAARGRYQGLLRAALAREQALGT